VKNLAADLWRQVGQLSIDPGVLAVRPVVMQHVHLAQDVGGAFG
jgi:hypothetical protein